MKKTLLTIALLFAFFSSNFALAGTYTYTSPWRPPYFEQSGDGASINVNSYCSYMQVSGSFNPSSSWPASDTYCDYGFYNMGNGFYSTIYTYFYSPNQTNGPSFTYTDTNYTYYDVVRVEMNASNGSGSYTVTWY
jgi:hypothetical protein